MAELTTRHATGSSDAATATWSDSRYVGAPVLVARWGLVVVAAILWLTVVPLVSVMAELRRIFTG